MDVAAVRGRPALTEQAAGDVQARAVHHRVRGVRVVPVVQPRVRHDPDRAGRPANPSSSPVADEALAWVPIRRTDCKPWLRLGIRRFADA